MIAAVIGIYLALGIAEQAREWVRLERMARKFREQSNGHQH